MKKINITFLFIVLLSMVGLSAFAHDIEVKNADDKTIYYNFINENTELSVTYRGSSYSEYVNEYTGNIVIPQFVTYNEKIYSVTNIGEWSFSGCSSLTNITIPNSVTSIDDDVFQACTGLTNVTIPNSVTNIGKRAFLNCYKLTSVTIPNSVTKIGKQAFSVCSGLTSITIPNSVTSIEQRTFSSCSNLTNITIPNNVTSIGYEAFSSCHNLTSIKIPNGVTIIEENAFSDCTGLTSIYSYIENPISSSGSYFDSSNYTNATLYVPYGTKDKYLSATGWKNFVNIVEMDEPSAINGVNAEDAKSFVGKFIKDNKIIIMKNGKKHSVSGQGM